MSGHPDIWSTMWYPATACKVRVGLPRRLPCSALRWSSTPGRIGRGCADGKLENGSRDVHTLGMVRGLTRKDQPPFQVQATGSAGTSGRWRPPGVPGHRAKKRDDLPYCEPSRLAHVDTPRGADPAEGALPPRRAQGCYGSRVGSMAAPTKPSQARLMPASTAAFQSFTHS